MLTGRYCTTWVLQNKRKMARSFSEECSYLEPVSSYSYRIKKGFVPNMRVSLFTALPGKICLAGGGLRNGFQFC